jgi:hypothetical protein
VVNSNNSLFSSKKIIHYSVLFSLFSFRSFLIISYALLCVRNHTNFNPHLLPQIILKLVACHSVGDSICVQASAVIWLACRGVWWQLTRTCDGDTATTYFEVSPFHDIYMCMTLIVCLLPVPNTTKDCMVFHPSLFLNIKF